MKLLLVCNPGGHLSTMFGLQDFWQSHSREWVTYQHFDSLKLLKGEQVHWVVMQEARMIFRAFINFFKALWIVYNSKPDLVVTTGASLSVPFVLSSKLLGVKSIFIESISRSEDLSLSGKILYHFVDELYVQWPQCQASYPKVEYHGIVVS